MGRMRKDWKLLPVWALSQKVFSHVDTKALKRVLSLRSCEKRSRTVLHDVV